LPGTEPRIVKGLASVIIDYAIPANYIMLTVYYYLESALL